MLANNSAFQGRRFESRNDVPSSPSNDAILSGARSNEFRISHNSAFTRQQLETGYDDPYAQLVASGNENKGSHKKKNRKKTPSSKNLKSTSEKKSILDSPTSALAPLPYLPKMDHETGLDVILFSLFRRNKWRDIATVMSYLQKNASLKDLRHIFTATNKDDETILHVAAWKAPQKLTLRILETIPDSHRKEYLLLPDGEGNTPLHLACANLDEKDDYIVIKNVLLLAPEALETCNYNGDTPLHLLVASDAFTQSSDFAVEVAAEEAITSMLNMVGPHNVSRQNYSGLSLLHVAIGNHAHERVLVQLLTMAPDAAQVRDKRGMLPLHYVAASMGASKIPWTFVGQLIGAFSESVLCLTDNGDSPLHLLMSNTGQNCEKKQILDRNTTKLAEFLIGSNRSCGREKGDESIDLAASPLMVQNNEMLSPLHACAMYNTPPQLTRRLMESPFASTASALTTQFGATALHLLCASRKVSESIGNIDALATPEACAVVDGNDRTPLVVAVQNARSSSSVIKTLCRAYPEALTMETRSGFLPLHLAVQSRKVRPSIVKALIKEAPRTVAAVTRISGNTVLHEACKHGASIDVVKLLLEKYPKALHKINKMSELAVAVAIDPEVLQFLEKKLGKRRPVDVDTSNTSGEGSGSGFQNDSASV